MAGWSNSRMPASAIPLPVGKPVRLRLKRLSPELKPRLKAERSATMLGTKNRVGSNCADELRAAISGRVALPGDELYEKGCRVWNGAVRRRPAM
jgi:hypothetical protein